MNTREEKIVNLASGIAKQDFLILDTETTGLDHLAEACEISIINGCGDVLLDTLIKPTCRIPDRATAIHGITNEMVANAPTFAELHKNIEEIINSAPLGVYNFDYDSRILRQCAGFCNVDLIVPAAGFCVMNMYAELLGDWNDYYNNWRWVKLTEAASRTGYVSNGGKAHRALEDCFMTLHVLKYMSEYEEAPF